jgi:hypothetical protein
MTNPLYTLEIAIENCHDITRQVYRDHITRAAGLTNAGALADFVNGIRWEAGEDTIDNDQFRRGVEFNESNGIKFVRAILEILE